VKIIVNDLLDGSVVDIWEGWVGFAVFAGRSAARVQPALELLDLLFLLFKLFAEILIVRPTEAWATEYRNRDSNDAIMQCPTAHTAPSIAHFPPCPNKQ
jgi:hypothetical protein